MNTMHEPVSQFDEHGRYIGDSVSLAADVPAPAAAAAAAAVVDVEVKSDSCHGIGTAVNTVLQSNGLFWRGGGVAVCVCA